VRRNPKKSVLFAAITVVLARETMAAKNCMSEESTGAVTFGDCMSGASPAMQMYNDRPGMPSATQLITMMGQLPETAQGAVSRSYEAIIGRYNTFRSDGMDHTQALEETAKGTSDEEASIFTWFMATTEATRPVTWWTPEDAARLSPEEQQAALENEAAAKELLKKAAADKAAADKAEADARIAAIDKEATGEEATTPVVTPVDGGSAASSAPSAPAATGANGEEQQK
jgi:hypothetical protein